MFKKIVSWFQPSEDSSDKTGTIKFFNRRRGYGFIESAEVDKDIFVHVTDLKDFVSRGDQVQFSVEKSNKGYEAREVRLVAKNQPAESVSS